MDLTAAGKYNFIGLSDINILLGKNGSGKSTILKKIETTLVALNTGDIDYVTPERGGILTYSANIEQTVRNNADWERGQKRKNQWDNFKQNAVNQFKKLEMLSLREIEKNPVLRNDPTYTFDTVVNRINNLLTNIIIVRSNKGDFDILNKADNTKIDPEQISSGEAELIALTIECLAFEKSCTAGRTNFLLIDEPDVHLHPDLQANLMLFLLDLLASRKFQIIIATHSTAILGALLDSPNARFGILKNKQIEVHFKPINKMYHTILPIFGAHPLSNLFSQNPILLVEGDDDVRIWQQAIRTSRRLKLYPCSVDGVANMSNYEIATGEIIGGVYDNAKAYSLRDRDEGDENIDDLESIVRFKLSCRAAENLIVADEVLAANGKNWNLIEQAIATWIGAYPHHQYFETMVAFRESGFNRKGFDLKNLRNILIAFITEKPWEIAVGQVIGNLITGNIPRDNNENKISNFLGVKLTNHLLG